MDQFPLLTIIFFCLGLGFLAWFIKQQMQKITDRPADPTLMEWAKSTQADIKSLQAEMSKILLSTNKDLTTTLQKSYGDLHERLDKAAIIIGDLKKEAGQFSEISRSMRDLHDFLRSPKLRGNIGEQVLKDLIGQMFPKHSFHLQYSFKSGAKVDAAIQTDAGIIPIDSKFPMENFTRINNAQTKIEKDLAQKDFTRDVKKHIDDISNKYILPSEGTLDFALMYLPSESIYYEVANHPELLDYARRVRVYPVSPTTLYAHLQTILLGFEGKKMEAKSREVFRLLRSLQNDYEKIDANLSILGRHVGNAYNQMSNVQGSFQLLGQKLTQADQLASDTKALKAKEWKYENYSN